MIVTRYAAATPIGAAITLSLIYLMHVLLVTGEEPRTVRPPVPILWVGKVREDVPVIEEFDKPPRPTEVEKAPPTSAKPTSDKHGITVGLPSPPAPTPDGRFKLPGSPLSGGQFGLELRVAPLYPESALVRGLEGYVIVQFTVTSEGAVIDPVVVESSNSIFERAALNAVRKFRYRPRVVNGRAVQVENVQNKFSFSIEK